MSNETVSVIPYHVRKKLEEKEVETLDGPEIILRCKTCGSTWKPDMRGRKRLPKGYWRCPESCNENTGEEPTQTRMKVLLVDDDKTLNRSLAAILRSAGYIVTTAYTGTEAIEASKDNAFEAMILDIKLPDSDGIELLKSIKAVDRPRHRYHDAIRSSHPRGRRGDPQPGSGRIHPETSRPRRPPPQTENPHRIQETGTRTTRSQNQI